MVEAEEMEGTVGEVHLRLLGTMEEVEVEDLTAAGVVAAHMEEVEEEEDLTAERVVVVVVDTEARKAKEAEVATVEVEAKAAEAVDMEVRSPEVVRSLEGGIVEEVVDTASETFSLVSRSPFHEATLTKCIAPAIFTQCKFIVYLSLGRDTDFQFHQHCERRGMGLRMCRFRQRS